MAKSGDSKTLKDQNRWQLWLIIAVNVLVLYGAAQLSAIALSGLKAAISGAANLLPIGLAIVVTTVANGLLPTSMKDRLVFLRWNDALPGHRAFSVYARKDPRIDMARLQRALGNKLPTDPKSENATLYRIYLEEQNVPAVKQVHRDYLLLRDYTGLSTLFLFLFGIAAMFTVSPWQTLATYIGILLAQLLIVRYAAANYGRRFVCTILAQKAAKHR